jgi:hypothetical protein
LLGATTRQWRHEDSVGERKGTKLEWFK